jgi:hypothetical protein
MTPSVDVITIDTPLAVCWLEGGIFCVRAKETYRSAEKVSVHYQIVSGILKVKMPWLVDLTICQHFDIATKAIIHAELPGVCSALAILTLTPCSRMVANYFKKVEATRIPLKQFESEPEARRWLMNFKR